MSRLRSIRTCMRMLFDISNMSGLEHRWGGRMGAPMAARARLGELGLPERDPGELPTSAQRFGDGAQYRVEIPSVEGPEAFEAVLDAAKEHEVGVHRISQGSGVMLQTDAEVTRMVATGREHGVEVCLFTGPRA